MSYGDVVRYLIRAVHTLAATYVAGGAAALWLSWPHLSTTAGAIAYERGFWLAIGLLAATGVGNLASFAGGLPAPDTRWGTSFLIKLSVLVVLLLLSAWRTLVVARGPRVIAPHSSRLRVLYGATAILAVAIVSLAVRMAHP